MSKHASKLNGYLTYWKKKQTEAENFYRHLEHEAQNELYKIASMDSGSHRGSRIPRQRIFTENVQIFL